MISMDRAAVRKTRHGNHTMQMCPLAHWATTYIQQTVFKNFHGTWGPGTQERVKLAYQAKQPRFSVFI